MDIYYFRKVAPLLQEAGRMIGHQRRAIRDASSLSAAQMALESRCAKVRAEMRSY
jgi:hypothetical protein